MTERNPKHTPQDHDLPRIPVVAAWRRFLFDAETRKLRPATICRFRLMSRQMQAFAVKNGVRFLRDFDLPMIERFRASWVDYTPAAVRMKLRCLVLFLRFFSRLQMS